MNATLRTITEKAYALTADSRESGKITRFIFVGVLNTIVGYGSFFLLSYYMNYVFALVLSHIIGVTHSYIWNKYWTFGTRKNHLREFVKFNAVYVIAFVFNLITLWFLVDFLAISPRLGQLIALPVITLISYFGHRYWSFRARTGNKPDD